MPPDAVMTRFRDSLDLPAGNVREASEWLAQCCGKFGVPDDQCVRLDLCLNEIMANVISHGDPLGQKPRLLLDLAVIHNDEQGEATLTLSDSGMAFNPIDAQHKPRPATLDDASPGGLGLVMLKAFSDRLDYRRENDMNHLAVTVLWQSIPP